MSQTPLDSDPLEGDPLQPVAAALSAGHGEQAARLFLRLIAERYVSNDSYLVETLQEILGKHRTAELVAAFAGFKCFYCKGGISSCINCNGRGHGEIASTVCYTCVGLGATPCDFCGGSGLVTYASLPSGLRPYVAVDRTKTTLAHLAEALKVPLPRTIEPGRAVAVRKRLCHEVVSLGRDYSVLRNAAQFARKLRRDDSTTRHFTAHLFVRTSRAATAVQLRMSRLYEILATLSAHCAEQAKAESPVQQFEQDRADHFESESARLARAAQRRSALFIGR